MATALDSSIGVSRRSFLRGRSTPTPAEPVMGVPLVARVSDACLAKRGVSCRLCGDWCEPAAIHFQPRLGGTAWPAIQTEHCTGCGECLAVCPTRSISLNHLSKAFV